MRDLAEKSYWDDLHGRHAERWVVETEGFRNRFTNLVFKTLIAPGMQNKDIVEFGAGDSVWLPFLAKRFPSGRFHGLDYSAQGCTLLADRAARDQVHIKVIHEDLLLPRSEWHERFDVAYSFGVVEHFTNLAEVLAGMRRYLKPQGVLVTFIPNLAGVLGTLTRRWNKEVYDKHIPHDWQSFRDGHHKANLAIESGGYLGSTNFGTISSCFTEKSGINWQIYRLLTRISKAVWLFENNVCNLPATKTFSPYIYSVSRRTE